MLKIVHNQVHLVWWLHHTTLCIHITCLLCTSIKHLPLFWAKFLCLLSSHWPRGAGGGGSSSIVVGSIFIGSFISDTKQFPQWWRWEAATKDIRTYFFSCFVQVCPNLSRFVLFSSSKLPQVILYIFAQFCTFCTIWHILQNFAHFEQFCTFCTILHISNNFAHFAQFCTFCTILHNFS